MNAKPALLARCLARYSNKDIPYRSSRGKADHRRVLFAGERSAILPHRLPVRVHRGFSGDLVQAQTKCLEGRVIGRNDAAIQTMDDHPQRQGSEQGREQALIERRRSSGRAFHKG